jgi:WD40 repeat protein
VIAEALQSSTSDPWLAAPLTLAAYRIRPTQDLVSRLPLTGSGNAVNAVAYRPDGHILASINNYSVIWLWNLNVRYAIERICATTKGLTPQQWHQYIPQMQYKPPCAH